MQAILIAIVIGAVAGWLAGLIVKGGGMGLIGNIIVGIVGGVVAGLLFPTLGINIGGEGSVIGPIINSTIGAVLLLFVIGLVKR